MSGFTGKESRVLFFWAEWHEPSKVGMWQLVDALQAKYPSIHFERLEAEKETEMSLKFKVKVVPTFVALLEGEKVFERVEGVNPQEVSSMVKRLSEAAAQLHSSSAFMQSIGATLPSEASSSLPEELTERLKRLIFSAPVMVFMKGSPSAPRCGFSRQTADLLQSQGISFGSFDILNDEEVREGLKKYSDWPTFPQVYAHGELIGGLDILKDMLALPTPLKEQLRLQNINLTNASSSSSSSSSSSPLETRIKALLLSADVLLFMKGSPSEPKCGFSRDLVKILHDEDISFKSFDILSDEDVRQGLKILSDWPTFPQLYVRGELVGGLDIVREMLQTGGESLKTQLASLEGSAEYKTLHLKSIGEEDDDHNHSHDHAHGQSCGHAH